ncbi:MAG: YceD family protein [Aggregatilineales bacterium]
MTSTPGKYLHRRILKINVGFLLSAGPGTGHKSEIAIPSAIKVADDLFIEELEGTLRLTRTKEGVLLQGNLATIYNNECSRCLDDVRQSIELELEELYTHPASVSAEFSIGGDAMLDLAPLLRAEVLLATEQSVLCKNDCPGLCPICGSNLNRENCDCDNDFIDPRMAILKTLLEEQD